MSALANWIGRSNERDGAGVVSQNFRPEFINRIDEVVVFHPLGEQHRFFIAQIQLQRLVQTRLEERGL